MILLLRIAAVGALGYGLVQVAKQSGAGEGARTDELAHAFWLAFSLVIGVVTALLWAPAVADRAANPLTVGTTSGPGAELPHRLLRLIRTCERRGWRRLARWLSFLEGVRHPWRPAPFVIGMNTSEPGSWLERVFAQEVYRFTNVENCVRAYEILCRHGRRPAPHARDEVNRSIASRCAGGGDTTALSG
jgi:hypothetical protein